LQAAPRGHLRVNAPMSFGFLHLAPALGDFLARYPEVELDVTLTDRFIDLIDEGVDVAVRIGTLTDSSLVARRLAVIRRVLCASPDYLARRGVPRTPDDLKNHDCLSNTNINATREWRFIHPDGTPWPVEVKGRMSANSGDMLRVAALRGHGFVHLPTFIVGDDIKAGTLVSVLEPYISQDLTLSAVYPTARHLSPKVRAFVDFLGDRFGGPEPYWDAAA
jgi:DNA-binding transcriptional LysR family regulator